MADNSDSGENVEKLPFFARVDDAAFWSDRERVKTLIELYESFECLWNIRCAEYKNVVKKKSAKVDVGKHFGWSGKDNDIIRPPTCPEIPDFFCPEIVLNFLKF
jgi:hypothetical protein